MAVRDIVVSIGRSEMERCPIAVKEIEWKSTLGEPRCLDLHIAPVVDSMGSTIGTVLTYVDSTEYRRLQRELEQSQQELGAADEELQSTNEEMETTNEELQSTVEELETTNDKLQSLTKSWKP